MSLDSPISSKQVATTTEHPGASEWTARPLRPVAHWVLMPDADGRSRLTCVWEVPDPIPPA